jgi:hypothetical protein
LNPLKVLVAIGVAILGAQMPVIAATEHAVVPAPNCAFLHSKDLWMDYNNDPSTTLADVHSLFSEALHRIPD